MKRRYLFITILAGLVAIVSMLASCLITVEMEGDYASPDSLQMTIVIEMTGEKLPEVEVVKIGEDIYVKDPEIRQWMRAEDVESYYEYQGLEEFALSSIDYILAFEGTNMLGDEDINGISCYHIKGIINPEKVVYSAQELIPMDTELLVAELWIGKNDYLVHQLLLDIESEDSYEDSEIPISAGKYTLTYQFSKFNEPINIEAPELVD